MPNTIRARLTLANVMAGVALFLAMGGGAYAASTNPFVGSNGRIGGCVPKKGGTLKVVRVGHGCPKGTRSLAFGQVGAKGATGAAGAPGASGPAGATGAAGLPNPSATTVDGETVAKILFKVPTPATPSNTQLFSTDGLTLIGQCDNAGNATVQATGPASSDSEITYTDTFNGGMTGGAQVNGLGPTMQQIGPDPTGNVVFSYASSAGQVITGSIGYAKTPAFGGSFNGCVFFGTVTYG